MTVYCIKSIEFDLNNKKMRPKIEEGAFFLFEGLQIDNLILILAAYKTAHRSSLKFERSDD